MILLVSGEGPTDIGATQSHQCPTPTSEVEWGPMGRMINKLVEPIWWDNAPIETCSMMLVAKTALLEHQRSNKAAKPRSIALPGRVRPQETAFFFDNARSLARMAKDVSAKENCPTGVVLFRDADGTRSSDRSERSAKVQSIQSGFDAEDFNYGVSMVPQPKSEAWLLCALQQYPYQNCARFETLSGNDDSPNPAKALLDAAIGQHATASALADYVSDGTVDVQRIDMPSFKDFKDRMIEVAKEMRSFAEVLS